MLIPLALVVFLLVTTAIIAPWSDNLGKKLGKKRVSVFGLRPRTSATILTIASSWVIMFFTLGALLLTVAPLKDALFHYERDRARAIDDVKAEREKVSAAQRDAQSFRISAQNSRIEAQNANAEAQNANAQTRNLKRQTQNAQRNFQNAKRGEQSAQKRQQRAAEALASAQAELGTSQQQLSTNQRELKYKQSEIERAKTELTQANAELKQRQQEAKAAQARSKAAQAHEKSAKDATKRAEDGTQKAKSLTILATRGLLVAERNQLAAERENLKLEGQRADLKKDIDQLRAQLATVRREAAYKNGVADVLAYASIRVPVDQTLAERRFDATRDAEQMARQLRILVDAARHAISNEKSGLVPGAEFTVSAAIADQTTGNPIDLDETQAVQFYARALSSANQTVSARLVSAFNYPGTATIIAARFVFVPIRTLYLARENIAEDQIDATKSKSAIFGQLQNLLDDARHNAVGRGAFPPLSPDDKNFYDGDTGPKLFATVDQVKQFDHPVSVRIVAARDLDSAEPLQVRFIVGDETA